MFTPTRSALIDGFDYRLASSAGISNAHRIALAAGPIAIEREPNDEMANAQVAAIPSDLAGRIDRANDRDWYRLDLKRGDDVVLELFGDRIGSPFDFYLAVKGPADRQPREFDDPPPQDLLHPSMFYSRTFDPPAARIRASADGPHFVMVGARDSAIAAGPRAIYRLRIAPLKPDFQLLVMPRLDNAPQSQAAPRPEALIVPSNGRQYLDVYVSRRDEFAEPIVVAALDLPQGVTCAPQFIPARARQAALVLEADGAPRWAGAIRVVGKSTIDGQAAVRDARPASVTWPMTQRNAPAIARLDRQLVMAVGDPAPFALTTAERKLVAQQGTPVRIVVEVERFQDDANRPIALHLLNQQSNVISLNDGVIPADKSSAEVTITPRPSAPPGDYQIVLVGKLGADGPPGSNRRQIIAPSYPCSPMTLMVLPARD
jgi:hypothetical protein